MVKQGFSSVKEDLVNIYMKAKLMKTQINMLR